MLTAQEIFEKAAKFLLEQNAKCGELNYTDDCGVVHVGDCYYAHNGRHCAIGGLFDWDSVFEYNPAFIETCNHLPVSDPNVIRALRESNIDYWKHEQLLKELQVLHDQKPTTIWQSGLVELGEKHKLNTDFLK